MAGFRLNPDKDADILRDLNRFNNKTDRIKEMYRKAMVMEQGGYVQRATVLPVRHQHSQVIPGETEASASEAAPLIWKIPVEPTVDGIKGIDKEGIKKNILNSEY